MISFDSIYSFFIHGLLFYIMVFMIAAQLP